MKKLFFLLLLLSFEALPQVQISNFDHSDVPYLSNHRYLGQNDKYFYFLAESSFYGLRLWVSDGTTEGTHMTAYPIQYSIETYAVTSRGLFFKSYGNKGMIVLNLVEGNGQVKKIEVLKQYPEGQLLNFIEVNDEITCIYSESYQNRNAEFNIYTLDKNNKWVLKVGNISTYITSMSHILFTKNNESIGKKELFFDFKKVFSTDNDMSLTYSGVGLYSNIIDDKPLKEEVYFNMNMLQKSVIYKINTEGKIVDLGLPQIDHVYLPPIIKDNNGKINFSKLIYNYLGNDTLCIYQDKGKKAELVSQAILIKNQLFKQHGSYYVNKTEDIKLTDTSLTFGTASDRFMGLGTFTYGDIDFKKRVGQIKSSDLAYFYSYYTPFTFQIDKDSVVTYTNNMRDFKFRISDKSEPIFANEPSLYLLNKPLVIKFRGDDFIIAAKVEKVSKGKNTVILDLKLPKINGYSTSFATFEHDKKRLLFINKPNQNHQIWDLDKNRLSKSFEGKGSANIGDSLKNQNGSIFFHAQKSKQVNWLNHKAEITTYSINKDKVSEEFKFITNGYKSSMPEYDYFIESDSIHLITKDRTKKSIYFKYDYSTNIPYTTEKNLYVIENNAGQFYLKNLINNQIVFKHDAPFTVFSSKKAVFVAIDKILIRINTNGNSEVVSKDFKNFWRLDDGYLLVESTSNLTERVSIYNASKDRFSKSITGSLGTVQNRLWSNQNLVLNNPQLKEIDMILGEDTFKISYPTNTNSFLGFSIKDEFMFFIFKHYDSQTVVYQYDSKQKKLIFLVSGKELYLDDTKNKKYIFLTDKSKKSYAFNLETLKLQQISINPNESILTIHQDVNLLNIYEVDSNYTFVYNSYFKEQADTLVRVNSPLEALEGRPYETSMLSEIIHVTTESTPQTGSELVGYGRNFKVKFPEIVKGPEGITLNHHFVHEGRLYVVATTPSHGYQLWLMKGASDKDDDQVLSFEPAPETNLLLFPNPVGNQLNVRSKVGGSFKIVNQSGQILRSGIVQKEDVIDVSNFQSGVYMFVLGESKNTEVSRFVKE